MLAGTRAGRDLDEDFGVRERTIGLPERAVEPVSCRPADEKQENRSEKEQPLHASSSESVPSPAPRAGASESR